MYFVGPLVIRLTVGRDDEFVRHHSTEALNAMITFGIFWNVLIGAGWVLSVATGSGLWLLTVLPAMLAFVWIAITSIVGAVKAYRGEWWRYPGSIRLVRGAIREPRPILDRT